MSYNLVDSTTGALTRVAGRGRAEYGASSVRSGTYIPSGPVQAQEDLSFSVTFSEPMPDNDYQVIFGSSSNSTASGTIQCVVRSRSTTGFAGVIRNVGTSEISAASGTFTWFAFKLYSDVEYSNIVNSMPSDASANNKLVTKSDIVVKHNYSMAGTASLEDDIKTFVTALIALGANTYAGFFNRGGNLGTAGNYSITVYAEAGTSAFATGYITLGAGALGKSQYIVSYYKPAGSSEEWTIRKLVSERDTAKRKDVVITATASIEDDIKTLLDTLIAESSGIYEGSFTRTGNTSGHYSVSVVGTWNVVGIVSICGATSAAYRVAKFKNTEQGAYTYMVEQLATVNTVQSGTVTIPAQTLHNLESAEVTIPLTVNDFYCGRVDFANLPSVNMNLSYNDFSGAFQDARETVSRSQFVLYPIGKAYSGTLHLYLTNYTGADVAIGNVQVVYYLEHHAS